MKKCINIHIFLFIADAVYMCDEAELNEYVLNDTGMCFLPWLVFHLMKYNIDLNYKIALVGKVWMGSFKEPKGRRWVFGQYDDIVLPTVMYLLELSQLPHSDRGNPVHLTRAISAIVSISHLVFGVNQNI